MVGYSTELGLCHGLPWRALAPSLRRPSQSPKLSHLPFSSAPRARRGDHIPSAELCCALASRPGGPRGGLPAHHRCCPDRRFLPSHLTDLTPPSPPCSGALLAGEHPGGRVGPAMAGDPRELLARGGHAQEVWLVSTAPLQRRLTSAPWAG